MAVDTEQWGTLSIYDHRTHLLAQSLALFDRLIIPVAAGPIYDISAEEHERLATDVAYLEANDAAKAFPWDSDVFQEWQCDTAREALAVGQRDSLLDTRLMLKERAPEDVIATPVYGGREVFDRATAAIHKSPEELLNLELAQRLSVPDSGVPLQDIIELRARPSFQSSMRALRRWRVSTLPELVASPTERTAKAAGKDLKRFISRYEEELHDSKVKKRGACVVSILAIGAAVTGATAGVPGVLAILAAVAPGVFTVKDALRPFWKEVEDKEFAAAGVVYEAQKVFDLYRPRA